MKNIKDSLKQTGITIAKVGATIALAAMPYAGSAQFNPNGVPTNQIYNQFQKPNVHSQYLSKGEYEYYASGDVNNNGFPGEAEDAQAIRNGVVNDMADVNADGIVNEADAQMIDAYVAGTGKLIGIDYMSPEHTKEERKQFILNLYNNVYIPSFETVVNAYGETIIKPIPGWECGNYTDQAIHDFKGFSDNQGFTDELWSSDNTQYFRFVTNARFNIQCDCGGQTTQSGIAHAVPRFAIGENLLAEDSWLAIDGQTGVEAGWGSRFMTNVPGKKVSISWRGTSQSFGSSSSGQTSGPPICDFYSVGDGTFTVGWQNPYYIFNRPPYDIVAPTISGLEHITFEYNYSLDFSTTYTGVPTVSDDLDPSPKVEYSDVSTKPYNTSQEDSMLYNYNITRTWLAWDHAANRTYYLQMLSVRDTKAPEIKEYDYDYNEIKDYNLEYRNDLIYEFNEPVIFDYAYIKKKVFSTESTQIMDSTINQVNYVVSGIWTAVDATGNTITKTTQRIFVSDSTCPNGTLTQTTFSASNTEEGFTKIKESIINISDNSGLPTQTIIENTSGNFYDVSLKDVAGNERYLGNVELKIETGIEDIEGTNRGIDLEMQNPITSSTPYMNVATTNPGTTKLEVYDVSGRKLEEKVFTTSYGDNIQKFNFSNLNAGMYYFKVTDSKGNVDTKKIIKK